MSAHTPGPWILDGVDIRVAASHPSDSPICNMQPGFSGEDAVLIASAPELLAAAKRYLEFRHLADCGMGYRFSGVHPQTELKNAIARAEGLYPTADSKPKQCIRCSGYGTVSTGIDESPSTICNACEGTGEVRV